MKKGFSTYTGSKRKVRENVGLLFNKLETRLQFETEVLNTTTHFHCLGLPPGSTRIVREDKVLCRAKED